MVTLNVRQDRSRRVVVQFDALLKRKSKREGVYISLRDVEAETGIGASTLLHWKNNNVTRFDSDKIVALCDYFGCRVSDLIRVLPAGQ